MGVEYQVFFFQDELGVLQAGMSKFVQHTNLGVLQVGMSKFVQHTNHLPEKKLDKL